MVHNINIFKLELRDVEKLIKKLNIIIDQFHSNEDIFFDYLFCLLAMQVKNSKMYEYYINNNIVHLNVLIGLHDSKYPDYTDEFQFQKGLTDLFGFDTNHTTSIFHFLYTARIISKNDDTDKIRQYMESHSATTPVFKKVKPLFEARVACHSFLCDLKLYPYKIDFASDIK